MDKTFIPFSKIPRLSRECVVTEKIDGTNAQVHIDESGTVTAGSRTRWITVEKDNFGFASWVIDHADDLRKLGPGCHFGEWWGAGIQRGYGLAYKKFSLFNVSRWGDRQIRGCAKCSLVDISWSPSTCIRCGIVRPEAPSPRPACCDIVPVLYRGDFDTSAINRVLDNLKKDGSAASPRFMRPEGIIIFHSASGSLFKKTIEKDHEPKGKQP